MKLFLRVMCAVVISMATAPSLVAHEKTCTPMTRIDLQKAVNGCYFTKAVKRITPYVGLYFFYKHVMTSEKLEGALGRTEIEILKAISGILFVDYIKEDIKWAKNTVLSVFEESAPAAC